MDVDNAADTVKPDNVQASLPGRWKSQGRLTPELELRRKYLAADESKSDSSLTNISGMVISTPQFYAAKKWAYRAVLFFTTASATGGAKFAISVNDGVTSMKLQITIYNGSTGAVLASGRITAQPSSSIGVVTPAGSHYAIIEGTIFAAGSGPIQARFAQQVTDGANPVTVQQDSHQTLTQLDE